MTIELDQIQFYRVPRDESISGNRQVNHNIRLRVNGASVGSEEYNLLENNKQLVFFRNIE